MTLLKIFSIKYKKSRNRLDFRRESSSVVKLKVVEHISKIQSRGAMSNINIFFEILEYIYSFIEKYKILKFFNFSLKMFRNI